MSKATDFINNKCYQLGNPVEPLIFKADALEAISIASKEIEERAVKVYQQLCPCFQRGKCKHYPHNQKQGSQICDMECDRISYLKNNCLISQQINKYIPSRKIRGDNRFKPLRGTVQSSLTYWYDKKMYFCEGT